MNIYTKIAAFAVIAAAGVPTIAFGSSFTVSLIQGKTPTEAVQVIAEQIDTLTGRVATLEDKQAQTDAELDALRAENANLRVKADSAISASADVKADTDTKAQCSELSTELSAKENMIKAPFSAKIAPIQGEIRALSIQLKDTEEGGNGEPAKATGATSDMDSFNARTKASADIRSQIQAKRNEEDAISQQMDTAIEASADIKTLQDQLNSLLCA